MAPQEELPGLTSYERDLVKKLLAAPLEFPSEFKAWLKMNTESDPPSIPIGQIAGFSTFVPQFAAAESEWTMSGPGWVSSAPSLSGLPGGIWAVLWGTSGLANPATNIGAYMSVGVNGALATPYAENWAASHVSIARGGLCTLPNQENTISAFYNGGAGVEFRASWILALKVANL